jgi:Fe-S cluster biogenesis protein NfuA
MEREVEAVLDGLLPHLLSCGVDATLDAVAGGVVAVRLEPFDAGIEADFQRLRRALVREIQHRIPAAKEVLFVGTLAKVGERTGPLEGEDFRQLVENVLEREINPSIASHGGVIELVKVEGTEVTLEMGGGCQGCAASALTLRARVETALKEAVPEITRIIDVTDHGGGTSPYYKA